MGSQKCKPTFHIRYSMPIFPERTSINRRRRCDRDLAFSLDRIGRASPGTNGCTRFVGADDGFQQTLLGTSEERTDARLEEVKQDAAYWENLQHDSSSRFSVDVHRLDQYATRRSDGPAVSLSPA